MKEHTDFANIAELHRHFESRKRATQNRNPRRFGFGVVGGSVVIE